MTIVKARTHHSRLERTHGTRNTTEHHWVIYCAEWRSGVLCGRTASGEITLDHCSIDAVWMHGQPVDPSQQPPIKYSCTSLFPDLPPRHRFRRGTAEWSYPAAEYTARDAWKDLYRTLRVYKEV